VLTFYVDEDSSWRSFVEGLRMRGVDVLSAVEAGFIGMDDPTQLAFATEQDRVLWTFNVKDFLSLHAQWLAGGKSRAGGRLGAPAEVRRRRTDSPHGSVGSHRWSC
jgi:hypothetical protein